VITRRTWFDHVVGLLPIAGGIGIVAALLRIEIPEGNEDTLIFALGLILGWGGTVINNRFSSSKGSEDKTAMLDDRTVTIDQPVDDPIPTKESDQ